MRGRRRLRRPLRRLGCVSCFREHSAVIGRYGLRRCATLWTGPSRSVRCNERSQRSDSGAYGVLRQASPTSMYTRTQAEAQFFSLTRVSVFDVDASRRPQGGIVAARRGMMPTRRCGRRGRLGSSLKASIDVARLSHCPVAANSPHLRLLQAGVHLSDFKASCISKHLLAASAFKARER